MGLISRVSSRTYRYSEGMKDRSPKSLIRQMSRLLRFASKYSGTSTRIQFCQEYPQFLKTTKPPCPTRYFSTTTIRPMKEYNKETFVLHLKKLRIKSEGR